MMLMFSFQDFAMVPSLEALKCARQLSPEDEKTGIPQSQMIDFFVNRSFGAFGWPSFGWLSECECRMLTEPNFLRDENTNKKKKLEMHHAGRKDQERSSNSNNDKNLPCCFSLSLSVCLCRSPVSFSVFFLLNL